jgi:FkbM family methyltransferase
MMGRLDQIVSVLNDVRFLGAGFAWAALGRWRRRDPFTVALDGIGDIWVRGRDSDIDTLRCIFGRRDYEIPSAPVRDRVMARYRAILDSGKRPVIIDAGANIGAAALWYARLYPDAIILAVEPDPVTVAMLERNVARFPNIRIVAAALGSVAGQVELVPGGSSDATRTVRAESGLKVTTIADLVESVAEGVPLIAKIDIEGFEADVFAENTGWISDFYAIAVELHDWMLPGQRSSGALQAAMAAHDDFEIFLKGENLIYVRL